VTIKNAGFIANTGPSEVAVLLGNFGTNVLVNTGRIEGIFHAIESFDAIDKITNTKTIIGDIQLNGGNDTLTNSGKIFGNISLGVGADTFTNFHKVGHRVVSGSIFSNGVLNAIVDLGAGDDKFKGGAHTERVKDGDGHDVVTLGSGKDTYVATGATFASDLTDVINGGKGLDYYEASASASAVRINLDKVQHDGGPFGTPLLAANVADGDDVAGNFTDMFRNFENARGGDNSDLIYGSAVANTISGAGGLFDEIFGFGGNDKLNGEAGFDLLVGGRGKDILSGGSENDIFGYSSLKDSGTTKATRDVIIDFEDGTNRIDLAHIDANAKMAGDQAFSFIGKDVHFSGHRGQLLAHTIANGFLIEGDVNGDKKADFTIEVVDPDHSIVWSSTTGETFDL
jgi:Ca2+-binding RTX toxin-like protein